MGYHLNSLGHLPLDDDVNFYLFVINGEFVGDPLYEMMERNFTTLARKIGSNIIATGLKPKEWSDEVGETYLGSKQEAYFDLLPALLVTNAHPEQFRPGSLRLFVPLKNVEKLFGGWSQFFKLLTDLVQGKSEEFLRRFQKRGGCIRHIKQDI